MPLAAIGMPDRWDTDYPGHRWDYPLQRILVAARAAGVRTIDGPYADFRDQDGFRRSCRQCGRSATTVNGASTPTRFRLPTRSSAPDEAELTWARQILDANTEAEQEGEARSP